METIKIRCSSIGKIMTGATQVGLTAKQEETLAGLLAKIKLTERQAEERDRLIAKRDAKPELSVGAKTYVESLVKANYLMYEGAQLFSSKETQKGLMVEDAAISFLSDFYFDEYKKNDEYFSNEYIHGTPDIVHNKIIKDVKCPWSKATFPITLKDAINTDYEWQVRGYMWLTNSDMATIEYTLMDTPEELCKYEDPLLHQVYYLPAEKRVFQVVYLHDQEKQDMIKTQVEMCQQYAKDFYDLITDNQLQQL